MDSNEWAVMAPEIRLSNIDSLRLLRRSHADRALATFAVHGRFLPTRRRRVFVNADLEPTRILFLSSPCDRGRGGSRLLAVAARPDRPSSRQRAVGLPGTLVCATSAAFRSIRRLEPIPGSRVSGPRGSAVRPILSAALAVSACA